MVLSNLFTISTKSKLSCGDIFTIQFFILSKLKLAYFSKFLGLCVLNGS